MQQQTPMETNLQERAKGRIPFVHEGKTIYEWSQGLEEIQLFVNLPPQGDEKNLKINAVNVEILPKKIRIGLKGQEPYLDEELWSTVDTTESVWYIDDQKELCIECAKAKKGEMWEAFFTRHEKLDPFLQEEVRKRLMLQRFQAEHPGFDFSNATFSGTAPDPRTFMGGMSINP